MSTAATLLKPNGRATAEGAAQRGGLNQLHLHWAGVTLLAILNLYLLARLGMLWHEASMHNAEAIARQRLTLKAADAAAEPLRGVDAKVSRSTAEADRFYRERLPLVQSQVVAELGDLAKRNNVRMTRASYTPAAVLTGSANELTEEKIDASLSGDYRPLVQFINALERDKMFFAIDAVTLTGQQSGLVNLRLGLTTYLRGGAAAGTAAGPDSSSGTAAATGGAQ